MTGSKSASRIYVLSPEQVQQALRDWATLPEFAGEISGEDQVLFVAMTGGGKSTVAAALTLDVPSIVAIDGKGRMTLPGAKVYELPPFRKDRPKEYEQAVAAAVRWRGEKSWSLWDRMFAKSATNRVILRVSAEDYENVAAHNIIFKVLFKHRHHTIVWIEEITATGSTPQITPIWLRSISARGRTSGIGLWTLTQAPYGMLPGILKRNANIIIVGPITDDDAREMRKLGADIAAGLPTKQGYFVVFVQGDRQPYRMRIEIPRALARWEAP